MKSLFSTLLAPVRRVLGYVRNDRDMDEMYGDRRTRRAEHGGDDSNAAGSNAANLIGGWGQ